MSLYGDLFGEDKQKVATTGWATKAMQPAPRKNKPTKPAMAPPQTKPAASAVSLAPVQQNIAAPSPSPAPAPLNVKQFSGLLPKRQLAKKPAIKKGEGSVSDAIASTNEIKKMVGDGGSWKVSNEYDPHTPNDYEEYCQQRLAEKRAVQYKKDLARQMEEQERQRKEAAEQRKKDLMRLAEVQSRDPTQALSLGRGRGRGNTLPAWMTKPGGGGSGGGNMPPPPLGSGKGSSSMAPPQRPGGGLGFTKANGQFEDAQKEAGNISGDTGFGTPGGIASKMMAKMGYQEGQGLGAKGTGITSALEAKANGGGMGQIMAPPPVPAFGAGGRGRGGQGKGGRGGQGKGKGKGGRGVGMLPPPPKKAKVAIDFSAATPILLLRNMVGPGEVDAVLQEETTQECSKYGTVVKCLVFEVKGAPAKKNPDLAVRIFVQFNKKDSAIKAHLDLNGRLFGGRQVKADFYDEKKFDNLELAP